MSADLLTTLGIVVAGLVLFVAGSVFAFLAEHRRRLFPDVMFDDLFPSGRGRPSVPPDVIASVIVLQTLHGLSDRVRSVDGTLRIASPVGGPTVLLVELPCGS